ncbi:response regulator transcription factor, partial [Erysipelotrichaceae bacterium OttesenSCG-928-M19]|nr:response regulator transcription factor [Erysipelotrichaceae bacterium OttesenSCG-928-M19]
APLVVDYLEESGYFVEHICDSIEAINEIKKNNYDLVLSDLNLNKINGRQVVELVKKYDENIKIMILTCSTNEYDELSGLRVGADDYVTKESSFEVLVERIKNLLKDKKDNKIESTYLESKKDDIIVDEANRIVMKGNVEVDLTKLELDLLIYFLKNKNVLLSREKIYEDIWFVPLVSDDVDLRNIDAHVKNLQKKMTITSISSIRGIGYRWHE